MNHTDNILEPLEPYEPPESLWEFIKSIANERELDVIKTQIGQSLVETSIDLHNEIENLLEIWRDFRNETILSLKKLKQSNHNKLPEPPNQRETLKKEINLYLKQIREQFKTENEDDSLKLLNNNKHNLNVINYVLNNNSNVHSDKRPLSSMNKKTGAETPLITDRVSSSRKIKYTSQSRPNSSLSVLSFASPVNQNYKTFDENLELLIDENKLNSFDIDQIVDNIRELLQKECDCLINDIDFLYECLDKENEYRFDLKQNLHEPTLNELKEERKKLESDLLTSMAKNQAKISKLPSNLLISNNNRSINSPVLNNRLTPSPPSSAHSTRSNRSTLSINSVKSLQNNLKPVLISKRSSSLINKSKLDVKISSQKILEKQADNSKTNSVDLMSSLSSSSNNSKASSVQKFRQMVLESRD